MNQTIKDALRLAKSPRKPVRFHHTVARKGYQAGGHPEETVEDKASETVWQQPQAPAPVTQPDDAHQEAFLKEQLKGSAPQYDPAAGIHTAKEAGLMAAGMIPGTGLAAAAGKFPTAEGGFEPSLKEDISAGHYGSAFLKGLGAAGDIAQAVPVVGTAAGAAMKAPLAIKLASAMAPAARLAREASPAANAAEEVAPVAREAEAALPPVGVTGEVSVAPEMTKSQSQAAMKAAWEAGQGDTSKYKNWNHQWNVEEGPKFAAKKAEAPATVEAPAPAAVEPEVPAYQRLVNPAGFYSRAHEAAMLELPPEPRTWEEMHALLSKAPRVQAEELYWSGLHPEAFPAGEKVSREQIAELIQKNFPMVEPQIRTHARPEEYLAAKQEFISQNENLERLIKAYKEARQAESQSGNLPVEMPPYVHTLFEATPEHQAMYIERAPESMKPIIKELMEANDSFRKAEAKFEEAKDALPKQFMPKYEEYTVPGGTDYEERILRHQYSPESGSQASEAAFEKYVPELQRLNERAFDNTISLEERQAARQQHADLLAKANAEADAVAPEYTRQKYSHSHWDDTTNPVVHTRNSTRTGPNGEKIWHQEELQSDWAQEGREKGFRDPKLDEAYKQYETNRKQLVVDQDAAIDAAYKEYRTSLEEVRKKTDADIEQAWKESFAKEQAIGGDTPANADKINAIRQEAVDKVMQHKAAYSYDEKALQNAYKQKTEAISESTGQKIKELEANKPTGKSGPIPPAPYTRDTEHWLTLAAKDTLKEAIERGYDKIFITGGQEQAKRWANELRQAVDNVRWEGPQPRNELLDNTAYDIYAKPFADLRRDEQQYVDKILSSSPVQDYKTVYSRPIGQEKENFFTVVPEEGPGGKTIYKIVNSDISQAKGQTLSSVIGGDLARRVMAEESGDVPMKGYRMGSEGYSQTYERKAPSIYKKLLKSLDPEAKVEAGQLSSGIGGVSESDRAFAESQFIREFVDRSMDDYDTRGLSGVELNRLQDEFAREARNTLQDDPESWLEPYLPEGVAFGGEEPVQGTYIQITPKMRQEYERLKQKFGAVFPAYKRGGKVDGKPRVRYTQPEDALRISRKYAR